MILKKDFYFVRHGRTDYNDSDRKVDHDDVPLNVTGRLQAQTIEPLIADLRIKSVCFSPLKRAKETKELVSVRLQAAHYEIPELGECSMLVWDEMTKCGTGAAQSSNEHVRTFMQRCLNGINKSLSHNSPVLIVAHGGIHWAMCCLMGIEKHAWMINNCTPIYFFTDYEGQWKAKNLL